MSITSPSSARTLGAYKNVSLHVNRSDIPAIPLFPAQRSQTEGTCMVLLNCLLSLPSQQMQCTSGEGRGRGLFPSPLLPFSLTHLLCSSDDVCASVSAAGPPSPIPPWIFGSSRGDASSDDPGHPKCRPNPLNRTIPVSHVQDSLVHSPGMWYAGDRHTVHRLRTLPGAHLPSVFGDRRFRLIARAQEVARKKRVATIHHRRQQLHFDPISDYHHSNSHHNRSFETLRLQTRTHRINKPLESPLKKNDGRRSQALRVRPLQRTRQGVEFAIDRETDRWNLVGRACGPSLLSRAILIAVC
jgi:hypothetical protein